MRCALPVLAAEAALLFAQIAFGTELSLMCSCPSFAALANFGVAISADDVERRGYRSL
jgi:hypothetical protein